MAASIQQRRAVPLPEKTDGQAKATLDPLRKAEAREARRAILGAVLFDALVILRLTRLKEQAAFLKRDERQVARWFNGTEAAPWEELLLIVDLQFPLAQALLESCQRDLVEIDTTIRKRRAVA